MKKFIEMNENERLELLHNLLPNYGYDTSREYYLDRMKKSIRFDTPHGETIQNQLKKINFNMDTCSDETEKFLFLLTYITLTHSQRIVVDTKADESPNRKLIYHISNMDVDTNINALAVYFLVISDTYSKLKSEKFETDDLIREFNSQLNFQHREFWKKGEEFYTKQGRIQLIDKELDYFKDVAEWCYDNAYIDYFEKQEELLKGYLECIRSCKAYDEALQYFLMIFSLYNKGMHTCIDVEKENKIFDFIYAIYYIIKSYDVFGILLLENKDTFCENFQIFLNFVEGCLMRLENNVKNIRECINSDMFLKFASLLLMKLTRVQCSFSKDICNALCFEEFGDWEKSEHSFDSNEFNKDVLDKMKTSELLDYFAPRKYRNQNERNEIHKRLKYVMVLLNRLSQQNVLIDNKVTGKNLKIMYMEIYKLGREKTKISASLPKKHYEEEKVIRRSKCILLSEKYVRGVFIANNQGDNYKMFIEKKKELYERCIQLLNISEDIE